MVSFSPAYNHIKLKWNKKKNTTIFEAYSSSFLLMDEFVEYFESAWKARIIFEHELLYKK